MSKHYHCIFQIYPNRFALLATEIQILIYKIFTDNIHGDCEVNNQFFDLSNDNFNDETFETYMHKTKHYY